MRPLDPRLLRHARAARPYVLLTALLGSLTAAALVGQAALLARVIAGVAGPDARAGAETAGALALLAGLVAIRAGLAWGQERFGHRAATAVIAQLRAAVLGHLVALDEQDRAEAAATTTLLTRGLDALDGYLTKYLPQLLLVCTVTPAVLVVIWWNDTLSGVTVLLTLPLVPLFMAIVGLSTQAASQRRLHTLQYLGSQLLDLISGLPTLRAHHREAGQVARVRQVGDAHRRASMRTLASAFLSSLVLETMTTLSVALVAVGVGLRLVNGDLDLRTGLLVLILAPEAYLPLRMLGVHHHASADGLAACAQAFEILDAPLPERGSVPAPDLRGATIHLDGVGVLQPGTGIAAPQRVTAQLRPGEVAALVGPSGAGKSTLLAVLLGLRAPSTGCVHLEPRTGEPVDLGSLDPDTWWRQLAWVPQHPSLVPGTLAENVTLGIEAEVPVTLAEIEAAAAATGLDDVVAGLPHGWQTRIGQGGLGLSAGQRQRVALTRALLRPAPLVLLDEPTAHLDAGAEADVHAALTALRAQGRTVVLVAHRPALVALADQVIQVRSAEPAEPAAEPGTELAVAR
jgi:ATP-binding cassette subfamily C protein CydD